MQSVDCASSGFFVVDELCTRQQPHRVSQGFGGGWGACSLPPESEGARNSPGFDQPGCLFSMVTSSVGPTLSDSMGVLKPHSNGANAAFFSDTGPPDSLLFSPPPSFRSSTLSPPADTSFGEVGSHHHVGLKRSDADDCQGDMFSNLDFLVGRRPGDSMLRVARSLGDWIRLKGGRHALGHWLGSRLSTRLGEDWVNVSPEDLVTSLLDDPEAGPQLEELAAHCPSEDALRQERELTDILAIAKSDWARCVVRVDSGKRKFEQLSVGGARRQGRCQRRNRARKLHRKEVRKAKRKHRRRLACYRSSGAFNVRKPKHLFFGAWNTRGLGVVGGKDPEGKTRAVFRVARERQWNACLLTDTRFPEDGVSEVSQAGTTWTLIHRGKVSVALDPCLAKRWRKGGSALVEVKGWCDGVRAFGVKIPGEGWRPGFLFVPVYAPLAHKTTLEEREKFRELLSKVCDFSSSRCRLVLGGDFNAEVGATRDRKWRHVLGPFGDNRRTRGGEELLDYCAEEGLVVAGTYTRQSCKATWFHFRWGTAHTLDHFLVRRSDLRWVASVKTIRFAGAQGHATEGIQGRPAKYSSAPWLEHTDHDPIEMMYRVRHMWSEPDHLKDSMRSRPDVVRFMGSSKEAQGLRCQYAEKVTKELAKLSGDEVCWDSVADVMKRVAFEVVGPVPKRDSRPWLIGKESELLELEAQVHTAEVQLREARVQGLPTTELLQARRAASDALRSHKRRWEAVWWDDLADQANQANEIGDEYAFWRICRQLGVREDFGSRTGLRRTVADVEGERQAWRAFLREIQVGKGEVNPDVWQHVPGKQGDPGVLRGTPTRQEFHSALRKMKFGKRGGYDEVTVELIRFGSTECQDAVFQVICEMWNSAAEAEPGREAESWSQDSKLGICIPMFKNKGSRRDKNNYRNLVMLSVSAKLVARIAATRLNHWAASFLPEEQHRFRTGRGIDDAHQVARRVIEEITVAAGDLNNSRCFGLTCFDIVRAYTKVCRSALWVLLDHLGVPHSFSQVLRALHEHTTFMVQIHDGFSEPWFTERGLREGCPSSPILFSLYHHAVLLTFRARRLLSAESLGQQAGLVWSFKVDGNITRSGRAKGVSQGVWSTTLGDIEFADDTALLGEVEELASAELIFTQTLRDWGQQEHPEKREKLILQPGGRVKTNVFNEFEVQFLKHLGATLTDNADQWAETKKRVQAGSFAVKRIAKLWSLGTHRGRGKRAGLSNARRLRVMKCVLEGTLLACGKTRVWNLVQERKANQVLSRGVRRALGLDVFNMSEHGYSDAELRQMNSELVMKCREILRRVSAARAITLEHVRAHTGIVGNERADALAKQGSKGLQTKQSQRWLHPVGVPLPVDPTHIDKCWKCGKVYSGPSYAHALAGHEAHCKVPGAPPSHIVCRKGCGKQFEWRRATGLRKQPHHAREYRHMHEKICRGSVELTYECPFCRKVFPRHLSDETILEHRKGCTHRPVDAPDEGPTWACPRCKCRFSHDAKSTHIATCRGSTVLNKTCNKCQATFQTAQQRIRHETDCRGSLKANLTCAVCSRSFTSWGSRITHEKSCRG